MSKDILNPGYWADRMKRARYPHHSIFICPLDQWQRIEQNHQRILLDEIGKKPNCSILDIGCGYGRLLSLLPSGWNGDYLGIDLSPDFIQQARLQYPKREFICGDLLDVLPEIDRQFDLAIGISMRPMIIGNLGEEMWNRIENEVSRLVPLLLLLEYVEDDRGSYLVFDGSIGE